MTKQYEPSAEQVLAEKMYLEMGLTESEYALVQKLLGRLPNYTETGLFAVLWSEHCSYKNSKLVLKRLPTTGPQVLQGPGEGAGVVDIGHGQAVVFKIESHNHPSAVEPYHGASTGVGGILRDVFSMGAKPVAVLNSLRLGELEQERSKYLFREIVAGMAGYGNTIGVPTVGGEIQFDPCYEQNPLVNAMAVGLLEHGDLRKGIATGVGNSVIYVGCPTGRDGIHGATFASVEFSEDDEAVRLQVGYPEVGKRLMAGCLDVIHSSALVGIQDMGAAGLACSSAEMASKAGTGIELNLDLVPQSEEAMTAYEMMLSESQERMLLVVEKGREQEIIDIFKVHDLDAVVVGKVTEDRNLRLLHGGVVRAELPVSTLVDDAPVYQRESREPAYIQEFKGMVVDEPAISDLKDIYLKLLSQSTIASKAWVYEQFSSDDAENIVLGPGSNAAVIAVPGGDKCLALTTDCNSRYLYLDPYEGGAIAVAEAARNIVCSGGKPLAVTDGLNFGNPYKPEIFWQVEQAIEGISAACRVLETPVIGGNVSLSNETNGEAIYPTPIIGMVGLVENRSLVTTKDFKSEGDLIYLVGTTRPEFGGSELQKMLEGKIYGCSPKLDLKLEQKLQSQVAQAIRAGLLQSAHDLAEGGLAVALAECLVNGELGASVELGTNIVSELFSESQSRFIVSVTPENQGAFENMVDATLLGQVTKEPILAISSQAKTVLEIGIEQLVEAWKGSIPCLLN